MKFTAKFCVSVLAVLLAAGVAVGITPNASQVTVAAAPTVQTTAAITLIAYDHPWYRSGHWWKKHAPIIGGAAGGAAIGGLIGGGKGSIIGGAIGGTGGYLYKRHKRHEYRHEYYGYRYPYYRYRYR